MKEAPYSAIVACGDDAFEFLQGQLTADIATLAGDEQMKTAWCNPKGRVICLMTVAAADNGYTLTLPTELADEVVRRLTMFRFRAKLQFEIHEVTVDQLGIETTVDDWLRNRLRSGIAEIWRDQSEKFTPHMLNLDLLGAIDFDKGCYTGQEVVARTHYRGATKRRCLRFESAEPVAPGDKVSHDGRSVGEVVNAIGNDLLAVVPVDKAEEALTVGPVALTHVPLDYL